MESDFCFEDSVFSETRDRIAEKGLPYTAKQCQPRWFVEDVNNDDCTDIPTTLKFRADLAYRQEEYENALGVYSDCYVLIPTSNNAMRRDVLEGQTRCLIHLGRYKEALEIADTLIQGLNNTDHLTTALNLQLTIQRYLGNFQEVVSCLQQLISLHPLNPQFWLWMAESYMDIFLADGSEISEPSGGLKCSIRTMHLVNYRDHKIIHEHCNENSDCPSSLKFCTSREQLWMWSCASFIRARLLLQFIQPQHASFVLENNLNTQDQIEKQLNKFGLVEESKLLISEVMGEDILAERIKEEGQNDTKTTQSLSSFSMPTDHEFIFKWFHKIDSLILAHK